MSGVDRADIAIVGGGAAGLAAAVFAARGGRTVVILEKSARVGRKLIATGNGTCNITNIHAAPRNYHGADAAFTKSALAAFSPADAMAFFRSIGVICRAREDGRVYPICEQASAVLDCLRAECAAHGVREICDAGVTAIRPVKDGFLLNTPCGDYAADAVIVAAGGAASPSLGGSSDGYALLAALGHRRTPLFAAITQITAQSEWLRAVKGLRADVHLSLLLDSKTAASSTGELLFCDYGLSGPAALAVSRAAGDWERRKAGHMTAVIDLLPDWTPDDLRKELIKRRTLPDRTFDNLLTGLLNKRIGQTVLRAAGAIPLGRRADTLSAEEIDAIAFTIKQWEFPVTGTKGLAGAQVTAGGTDTAEFSPQTMQSRLVPGLYAVGEVLDVDGDCGGFNLQWAWSSAHAAVCDILNNR